LRALITGAGGFAGSHLAEYLLSLGQEVVALLAQEEEEANLAHIRPQLMIERADVRDADSIFEVLSGTKPHRMYHLAAQSSPARSLADPRLTYEVNFGGTLSILCAWHRLEFDSRLLYVSSADVYGCVGSQDLPLREETALRPFSPYAGSKAAAELLAFQFFRSYGLPIMRVRPFNHTGPRQSAAFVCSSFAKQIAEVNTGLRPNTVVVGNLKVDRDFSDVRDVVRGYYLLLEKGEPGEVYQLCSGRAVSIEAILQILIAAASKPVQVTIDSSRERPQESRELWGDPSKARQATGWKPQYALETTLQDLELYWERTLRP